MTKNVIFKENTGQKKSFSSNHIHSWQQLFQTKKTSKIILATYKGILKFMLTIAQAL